MLNDQTVFDTPKIKEGPRLAADGGVGSHKDEVALGDNNLRLELRDDKALFCPGFGPFEQSVDAVGKVWIVLHVDLGIHRCFLRRCAAENIMHKS